MLIEESPLAATALCSNEPFIETSLQISGAEIFWILLGDRVVPSVAARLFSRERALPATLHEPGLRREILFPRPSDNSPSRLVQVVAIQN